MDQMETAGLPGPVTLGGTALPLVGRARVYACGITPYDVTHLGHAATFVWIDTLARVLRDAGAEVIICRNVTDVVQHAGERVDPYEGRGVTYVGHVIGRDPARVYARPADQWQRDAAHLHRAWQASGLHLIHERPPAVSIRGSHAMA